MKYIGETFADSKQNLRVNKLHPKRTAPPRASTETEPEIIAKLHNHKLVLESIGIKEIGSLGKLSISGNIITQPGVLAATESPVDDSAESSVSAAAPTGEDEIHSKDDVIIERPFFQAYQIKPKRAKVGS